MDGDHAAGHGERILEVWAFGVSLGMGETGRPASAGAEAIYFRFGFACTKAFGSAVGRWDGVLCEG